MLMSHFNNTEEPFALTAFGMTFYVVTQAKHSAEVYKNTETLSFEGFVQGLMRINGNNEHAIRVMYNALPSDKQGFPNPHADNLAIEVLAETCNYAVMKDATQIEVPLYQWTSELFVQLGQQVYFGETLAKIDPKVHQSFLVFDELIWKILYQYPSFLSGDMAAGRGEVVAALGKYLRTPKAERSDAAWIISAMEDEMVSLGVGVEDMAIIIFHLYIAINTNTRKTIFWVITYLLHNPTLLAIFRKETEPAFDGDVLVDPFYFQDPAKCPQVDAIWHETLRMVGWSASIRLITKDTVIGGKLMREGNRVMVPHRLQHFDETVFGEETHVFRPERWLNGKGLSRSPSWHPFGAGKTLCSGRFLARYSVTAFVATVLRRFDLEMVGNPQFPQADEGRPVLGIISIKEGHDYNVRLTARNYIT
ncbi:uncharacterized protein N0V89_006770 [Didymosphaeria variabile]|uniref:Cytochrome P450 n=1 Tax=Didymosphaeria variabile TaxID=1932322 RepID=A0A9W9C9L7_9PLEO|nr:uncharacterized protein N0V89_006770 [Didymosphaeria variabile]KAJ4351428.1 hypothetical protein N0V89_006770 [Didymosphaeria variabile]